MGCKGHKRKGRGVKNLSTLFVFASNRFKSFQNVKNTIKLLNLYLRLCLGVFKGRLLIAVFSFDGIIEKKKIVSDLVHNFAILGDLLFFDVNTY